MAYIILNLTASSYQYKDGNFLCNNTHSPLLLSFRQKDCSSSRCDLIINIPLDSLDLSAISISNARLELPIEAFYPCDHSFHNEIVISSPYISDIGATPTQMPITSEQEISPASFYDNKLYIDITSFIHKWHEQISPSYQLILSIRRPNLYLKIFNRDSLIPKLHLEYENTNYNPFTPDSKPPMFNLTITHCNSSALEPKQSICFDASNPCLLHDINYEPETGYFSFNKPGYYYLHWIINLTGTNSITSICIGLLNQSTNTVLEFHSPCIIPSQICGQYILNVTDSSTKYALINASSGTIQLSNISTQSSLIMFKL